MKIVRQTTEILKAIIATKLVSSNAYNLVETLLRNISSYAIPRNIDSATYEIKNEDFGSILFFQSACTITASPGLEPSFQCAVVKAGTGDLTFQGFTGKGTIIATQYDPGTIIKNDKTVYIFGSLT